MTRSHDEVRLLSVAKAPAAEEIAEYLVSLIRNGLISAGEKLPTELNLSRRFNVSRTVVREAISRLKSDGLVESRQGSGVSVVPASLRRSFKLHDANLGRDQVIALLELRQPLEMASARLAAARHTEEELQSISEAQHRMETSLDWSDEGVQADLDFHHAIAKATGNPFYADFMAFLGARSAPASSRRGRRARTRTSRPSRSMSTRRSWRPSPRATSMPRARRCCCTCTAPASAW